MGTIHPSVKNQTGFFTWEQRDHRNLAPGFVPWKFQEQNRDIFAARQCLIHRPFGERRKKTAQRGGV